MTTQEIRIITHPALPSAEMTPLERLILTTVLDCSETEEGPVLFTDYGPKNPIRLEQRDLLSKFRASAAVRTSALNLFIADHVLPFLPDGETHGDGSVEIDLSAFPWQFIVQDILARSPAPRDLVVIQWINDPSQRPDTFGASVSLITRNGIFHATSEDLLREFRKRDQVLASDRSSADDSDPLPRIDIDDVQVDNPNDTVDAIMAAEQFITGFDDDETQEGIADILNGLRAAIRRERLRPVLLDALKELRAAARRFQRDAYRLESHQEIGNEAADLLSASLLNAERVIAAAEGRTDD